MPKVLITSVSAELWARAEELLRTRVENLRKVLCSCETDVAYDENGISGSPCTPQLWRNIVGTEHDETTCYFRHWFKRGPDGVQACRFSHLALMPLVRAAIWQGLLAEFVTGRLLGRDAVRIRVEDELEHHSSLSDGASRHRIGIMAQDFFGIVKNHLNAKDNPLSRAGLGSAEKMVVNLPGLDCRSLRKGWSNRRLRREIAQRIIDAGLAQIPTRREQEAFVWRWLSVDKGLKQTAPAAVMKILFRYADSDTGECAVKPWSEAELSEIRREARIRGTAEAILLRAEAICAKIVRDEPLTNAERRFKSAHTELFANAAKPKRGRKPKNAQISQKTKEKTLKSTKLNVTQQTDIRKESIVTESNLFRNIYSTNLEESNPSSLSLKNGVMRHRFDAKQRSEK